MNRSTKTSVTSGLSGVAGAAAILIACGGSSAQTSDAGVKARQEANRKLVQQPIRYARSVRPPVIDLEAMAKERRPGQVMPGDAYVSGAMPFGVRREPEPLTLPDSDKPLAPKPARRTDVPTLAMPRPTPAPAAPTPAVAAPAVASEPITPQPITPQPAQAPHAIVHEPDPGMSSAPVAVVPAPIAPAQASPMPAPAEPAPEHASAVEAPASVSALTPAPMPTTPRPVVSSQPEPVAGAGIDALLVENLAAPMSTAPARVDVSSVGGVMSEAQWRTADGAWRQPRAGETLEGKIEIRAGINGEVTVIVDERVQITVSRLGRIVIERALERGDTSVPTIALARGAIDVRPVSGAPAGGGLLVRVRTPDQVFGIRTFGAADGAGVRVEYDAFTGTLRRASNP